MSTRSHGAVLTELKRLSDTFFSAASFDEGEKPSYPQLYELFIEPGLLIKNSGPLPEIGVPFEAQGMISTQFILTPAGWRMSSMAWDDERPGLKLPEKYEPTAFSAAA